MKRSLKDPELQNQIAELLLAKYKVSAGKRNIDGEELTYQKPQLQTILTELNCLANDDETSTGLIEGKAFYPEKAQTLDWVLEGIPINSISIEFTTPEIILEGINLGQFQITLNIDFQEPETNWDFIPVALQPNPSITRPDSTHPNIDKDFICLGEYETIFDQAIQQGRFSDVYELMVNLLNTVSINPYIHIRNWAGEKCSNCEEFTEDETQNCSECQEEVCDNCSTQCYNRYCGNIFHTACRSRCLSCYEIFCSEHLTELENEFYCEDCTEECSRCNILFPAESLADGLCKTCDKTRNCFECDKEVPKEELDSEDRCSDCHEEKCLTCKELFPHKDLEDSTCSSCLEELNVNSNG